MARCSVSFSKLGNRVKVFLEGPYDEMHSLMEWIKNLLDGLSWTPLIAVCRTSFKKLEETLKISLEGPYAEVFSLMNWMVNAMIGQGWGPL